MLVDTKNASSIGTQFALGEGWRLKFRSRRIYRQNETFLQSMNCWDRLGRPSAMLHVHLRSPDQETEFQHSGGPLEIGRGPPRDVPRHTVNDPYVSYDQIMVMELENRRLQIENLSKHVPIEVAGGDRVDRLSSTTVNLPVNLRFGRTHLKISPMDESAHDRELTQTLDPAAFPPDEMLSLRDLGTAPDAETLARWFEIVICVQQSAANSSEFFGETARAVVKLVGLDQGLVLLRENDHWKVVAQHRDESRLNQGIDIRHVSKFSQRVLDEVLKTGRTYYQSTDLASPNASLTNIEAVVAAPILDRRRKVVGVVYGSRTQIPDTHARDNEFENCSISPLEAQIIQVLAAAVGAGLERVRQQADAMRSQLQFENFFSSKLATELARDTNLLAGRQREVTIVFSDVRDFTLISEHLGPSETFHMMQDVMDLQTATIYDFDGVVVDYVGDGLLAMWNAPTDQSDHARLACNAVLQIIRQMPALNEKWQNRLNRPLQLGVGINTGVALVGNTGSRVKFKYGPMGSAVNLASRIEEATKQLGAGILLTESTYRKLDDSFATRRLCKASLPGIAEPVHLYELSAEENSGEWQARRSAFETALAHFTEKRWADACLAIYPLISDSRGQYDVASLHLLSRAVECMKSNPEPFDPIVYLKSE
jgi:adenylate cyclase